MGKKEGEDADCRQRDQIPENRFFVNLISNIQNE